MRVVACLLFPLIMGREGLYFVDAAAWFPTMLLMIAGYFVALRKRIPTPPTE
jgi:hypothetical protein